MKKYFSVAIVLLGLTVGIQASADTVTYVPKNVFEGDLRNVGGTVGSFVGHVRLSVPQDEARIDYTLKVDTGEKISGVTLTCGPNSGNTQLVATLYGNNSEIRNAPWTLSGSIDSSSLVKAQQLCGIETFSQLISGMREGKVFVRFQLAQGYVASNLITTYGANSTVVTTSTTSSANAAEIRLQLISVIKQLILQLQQMVNDMR